jgi:6,7-dimethyl-8-ribityllumazine synthase
MNVREITGSMNAQGLKVCIAVSRFNDGLTRQLLQSALEALEANGAAEDDVTVVWVPGSDELPLAIRHMSEVGEYDTFLALGCIIQGKTMHAEVIANNVSYSLAEIAKELKCPVINGVISAGNYDQAVERCGIKARNRGKHASEAAIEMANLYREVQ